MFDCSEKLKALREARGWTQLQVATHIRVSKAMISAYETASKAPSIDVLIRLSHLYGVSVDYLVHVDSPKNLDVSGLDDESIAHLSALVEKLREKSNQEGGDASISAE